MNGSPGFARAPVGTLALVVVAVACSGKPRAEDAAHGVAARGEGAALGAAAAGDAAPAKLALGDAAALDATSGQPATGDLQVRVEWPDVPAAARSSPGRNRCNTPRAPSVAPTTTWGIPDALVIVEGVSGPAPAAGTPPSTTARVTLASCALAPRVAVGDSLAIASAVDRPAKLVLRKRGTLDHLASGPPVTVMLPIAGHTVMVALDPGAIYSLETDEPDPDIAFIAAVRGGFVSDATGHVVIRDLAVGAHVVTAWLPPRGGQPARVGHGTATVAAGDLAELTVKLTK